MDFFPSEVESVEIAGRAPDPAARSAVIRDESNATEVSLQVTNKTELPGFSLDIIHLNLNLTQTMKEVQRLEAALGQIRTMTGELTENYYTLLKTCGAANQQCQEIQTALDRVDSLAQRRLDQLSSASELATRTEAMLARVEGFSAETDRQLTAIGDARNLLSRDLARAKAETPTRTKAADASPTWVDRFTSHRMRLAAIAAMAIPVIDKATARLSRRVAVAVALAVLAIDKATARISRRVAVAVALAVLAVVAVVGIVVTWPDGNVNAALPPVIESRVVRASVLQLPELPQGLRLMPEPLAERRPLNPGVAKPAGASTAGAPTARFIGELAIQSSPPGAAVFIDGKPVGETPLTSLRVRAGSHAIRIELLNFRPWTTAVHVPAGRLTRVNTTLQLAPNQ